MSEIDAEVKQLIEAVKKSKTFEEYDKQKNILKADPDLKAQVDNYRREVFELQNSNDGNARERMEAFAEKYSDFVELPKVSAFLDAEVNLCKMMQELTHRVVDSLEFE